MAAADLLIVEDGTNIVDSNTYVSYADFVAYTTLYNYETLSIATEEKIVAAILKASDYLESFKFKGVRAYDSQNLSFPRLECFPTGAYLPVPFDTIPKNIKKAQLVAATIAAQGIDLFTSYTPTDVLVTKEKIGPIETEYANNAALGRTTPIFSEVDALLEDYVISNGRYALRAMRV